MKIDATWARLRISERICNDCKKLEKLPILKRATPRVDCIRRSTKTYWAIIKNWFPCTCMLIAQSKYQKTWSNLNSRIPFAELQNCDLIWIWMDFSCDPFLEFFDASHLLFDRLWKFWHPWLFSIWSEPLHWRAQPSKLSQTATLSSASSLYGIPSCQR